MKHSFGGPWTLIKLDVLKRYLIAFNTALKNVPSPTNRFHRIYIDAFAGTGECEVRIDEDSVETIEGSAKLAIDASPQFDEIHLIDHKEAHVKELKTLTGSNPRVHVHQEDANLALQELIQKVNWKKSRGVLFLDPYGMTVSWSTLQLASTTHALDVWYLFPLSAIYRQAANDFNKIDDSKLAALDTVLGTTTWRDHFYKSDAQISLIDGKQAMHRVVDPDQIAAFVQNRLKEEFKGWVSPAVVLRSTNNAPLFALFCCISNPTPAAVKLSQRLAEYILGKFTSQPIALKATTKNTPNGQGNLFN